MPAYRFALVDHPIGSRTLEEIRARARTAYEHVRSLLQGARDSHGR
ncbi:MAG TPA: hypothetical protein VNN10_15605 [Dehalococcoidia bacterium]|nr:hypothetical protein [Dehalococcoidia bacterium]